MCSNCCVSTPRTSAPVPYPSGASNSEPEPFWLRARGASGVEGTSALDIPKGKTMTTLTQASQQWASRPADERFLSLHEMGAKMRDLRDRSRQTVESTRKIELFPDETDPKHRGLYLGMDAC